MVHSYKKEMTPLLIEVSVPNDFGLNNAGIRKTTKYQDLQNEVKRTWKLKNANIMAVIVGAMGVVKKNLNEILKTLPVKITTNKLQLETSMTVLKRTLGTKL